ncbi:protein brown [Culicoides brevitarsis]|uniref:protein brown n=1 Tax=Culicoides brevitarsis TaxID=469753 RepID=UPI00307BCFF0
MELQEKRENFTLEWRNLSYIPKKRVDLEIGKGLKSLNVFRRALLKDVLVLDNVNGRIESGSLVAVIGSSGCGKTSLLAAIAQRIQHDVTGDIFINQQLVDQQEMRSMSGYVPQSDISIPTITPFEHLYFMLQFKNCGNLTSDEKKQKIHEILRSLSLAKTETTPIKSLSGGEKRKLLLATSLIFDPLILFCDEITTGLDSFQASSVTQSLRSLVGLDENENRSQARAVICSVHQPSSSLFHLFSHLILMSNGKIVFQGRIEEAVEVFEKAGMACPKMYNPAEFYVKMVSQDRNALKLERVSNVSDEKLNESTNDIRCQFLNSNLISSSNGRVNWFKQLFLLMLRSILSGSRNYKTYLIQSLLYLSTPFVIGILYSNVSPNSQASIQDINGAFFNLITEMIFTYAYYVVFLIPEQYSLLRRETGEELYTFSAYYVSKTLILIPKVVIETFIFMAIVCFLTPFNIDLLTFCKICVTLILASITSIAYGFSLAGVFESARLTIELGPPVDLVFLILGGVYINVGSISYMKYFSMFFYANEAISYEYWKKIDTIACNDIAEYPCLTNGTQVLEHLGLGNDSNTVLIDYVGLLGLATVLHLVGFFGIRRIIRKQGFY